MAQMSGLAIVELLSLKLKLSFSMVRCTVKARFGTTSPIQRTNPGMLLGNDHELYSVPEADSRAFGARHLNIAVVKRISAGRGGV
jgi:hypothetical protein